MLIYGASVKLLHKNRSIGDTLRYEFDDQTVAFGIGRGDVIADAYVATLDALVELDQIATNRGIQVENASVILAQPLNFLVGNKT